MQFNNWDLVYSVHWDKSVCAVVDFETKDWKVYVSPWWKKLSYPERLILNTDMLFKKTDEVFHISKKDINSLMKSTLDIDWDIDNPPENGTLKVWDQIRRRWYTYKLVDILDNGNQIFERNNALYIFEDEDVKKINWTKAWVIKEIYGLDIDKVILE